MPPTILKRRHDLKNKNATLKLMKKFKDLKISPRMEWARFKSNEKLEELTMDELKKHIKSILDDDADLLLEMAGAPVSEDSLKGLAHVSILLANEIGQHQGHDLQEKEVSRFTFINLLHFKMGGANDRKIPTHMCQTPDLALCDLPNMKTWMQK